jgi:hypothetical protein
MNEKDPVIIEIRDTLQKQREEWRRIRKEKLELKEVYLSRGMDKKDIKKESIYKNLDKKQRRLSTLIKHIEQRLNRKLAKMAQKQ